MSRNLTRRLSAYEKAYSARRGASAEPDLEALTAPTETKPVPAAAAPAKPTAPKR